MKRWVWVLAAGLVAAAVVPPVTAADLGDGTPPPWQDGGYYEDPRFRSYAGPPPSYDDDDDDDAYDVPRRHARELCVRSEQVRRRLTQRGWHDFHAGEPVNGDTVTLRARRPSGRLFELKLDRCSGDLIATRPVEARPFGPYAYREPPPRRHPHGPAYAEDDRWQGRPYARRDQRRWDDD